MPRPRSANPTLSAFLFTLHVPADFEDTSHTAIFTPEAIAILKYACWQLEIAPTTGQPHLQGYGELKSGHRPRLRAVKALFCGDFARTVHVEARQGTRDQARDYCRKEDTRAPGHLPQEFGRWGQGRGERMDLEAVRDMIANGASLEQIDCSEHSRVAINAERWCRRLISYRIRDLQRLPDITLRPWQESLLAELSGTPDPRRIIWIYDPEGGKGKSTFSKWLTLTRPGKVARFHGGSYADVAFAYGCEPIVLWDLPRTQMDKCPYGLMENFKNGCLFSPKYESTTKMFDTPHIVVFSNTIPKTDVWTEDRYDVREIGDDLNFRLRPFSSLRSSDLGQI